MTDDIKCPRCGSKTILRTAKKGSNAGKNFYVCVKYPKCKGKILKSNDVKQTKIDRLSQTPVSVPVKAEEHKSEQAVKVAEPISQKVQDSPVAQPATWDETKPHWMGILIGIAGLVLLIYCIVSIVQKQSYDAPVTGYKEDCSVSCQNDDRGPCGETCQWVEVKDFSDAPWNIRNTWVMMILVIPAGIMCLGGLLCLPRRDRST